MPGESSSPPEYKLPFKRGWKLIELGGGEAPVIRPNADMRWLNTVDIVCSFEYPLPIPSGSYDGLFAKFVLEHLSWRKVKGFMAECHRILKPGGIAVFVTANTLEQCRKAVETTEWDDTISSLLFGDLDYPENSHKCAFSPAYAVKLFKEAGFYEVLIKPWPAATTDMVVECYKSAAVIV